MSYILCVDDDPDGLKLITAYCKHAGYEVLAVGDGQDALNAAARQPPRAIVLDYQLPDVDGERITRLLKEHPNVKHVPILCVTAHDDVRQILHEAGADAILSKPLRRVIFLNTLKRLLENDTDADDTAQR